MSELRAAKSGFALEAQKKMNAKYDQALACQCMEWVKRLTGEDIDCCGDPKSVCAALKDGLVLEKLQKKIQNPSAVPQAAQAKKKLGLQFQANEKLTAFNNFARDTLGVPPYSTFTPENLTEETNMPQVINCLQMVAMKCLKIPGVEGFGPKEAEANIRHFSQEQLDQGKSTIGLQMGSNKGASQTGQNFGKTRMITD